MGLGKVLALGTVHLDVIGKLDSTSILRDRVEQFDFANLRLELGGTAHRVARAAVPFCSSVCAVGLIGGDFVGRVTRMLVKELAFGPITYHLIEIADAPTGVVLMLHTATGDRLLVGPETGCARDLAPGDLSHRLERHIENSNTLLVDGYCMLSAAARPSYLRCIELARHRGLNTVYDIVPHHSDSLYDLDSLRSITANVAVVTSSLGTIAGFLRIPIDVSNPDSAAVERVCAHAIESLELKAIAVRYGRYGISRTTLMRADLCAVHRDTSSLDPPPAGYGDQLTMEDLVGIFGDDTSGAFSPRRDIDR